MFNKTPPSYPPRELLPFGDASDTLALSQHQGAENFPGGGPSPHETPVHAQAGKYSSGVRKLYIAHSVKQSVSVETLLMICMSLMGPPFWKLSTKLALQRTSNEKDDFLVCCQSVCDETGLLALVAT